jgi:hypothetical protein
VVAATTVPILLDIAVSFHHSPPDTIVTLLSR